MREFGNKQNKGHRRPAPPTVATSPSAPALDAHETKSTFSPASPRLQRSQDFREKSANRNAVERMIGALVPDMRKNHSPRLTLSTCACQYLPEAHLVHVRMPVLIMGSLGFRAVYSREERGLCQIQQGGTDAKSFGNCELDLLPNFPERDTTHQSDIL